jgi:thioesterase domain-containing protein
MSDLPVRSALSYLLGGLKRRLHLAGPLLDPLPETAKVSFEQAALRRVKEKAYISYTRYKPSFYPGKITLVATAEKTFFPGDPAAIWSALSADLEVDVIPGTHLNIVTTEVKALGEVLTRHIQRRSTLLARQCQ